MAQAVLNDVTQEYGLVGDKAPIAPALDTAVEQWLRRDVAPALAAMRNAPSRGLASGEVLARIAEEHAKRQ